MFFFIFLIPFFSFLFVDNLFFLWLMIEIQTLFFMLYIWNSSINTNNILYFLVIQMFCSGILFFFIYVSCTRLGIFYFEVLFQLILFFKIGLFPFQGWALWFCDTVSYSVFFLFLTGTKIIPLLILRESNNHAYIWLFLFNIFFSSIFVFFSVSYTNILFFSSIFITSLLVLIGFSRSMDVLFLLFLVYSVLIFLVIMFIPFSSINMLDIIGKNLSVFLFILVMSMVGIPFSIGFLLKVLFLQIVNEDFGAIISFVLLIVASVAISYFYIKLLHTYFMFMSFKEVLSISSAHRRTSFGIFLPLSGCFLVILFLFTKYFFFF